MQVEKIVSNFIIVMVLNFVEEKKNDITLKNNCTHSFTGLHRHTVSQPPLFTHTKDVEFR